MADRDSLTTTNILAAASDILRAGGYQRIDDKWVSKWATTNTRFFEDAYTIVAIVAYETWRDLSSGWADAQGALVELISEHVSSAEAKAWDGYLVLFTPGTLGLEERIEATQIRYDTSRLRKLIAAGDELKGLGDVESALLPLLPLRPVQLDEQESVLDVLPDLLSRKGLPEYAVRVVIDAYSEQEQLMERLHARRTQT